MSAARAFDPFPEPEGAPPLENGDHVTRAEFERRYEAMPHIKKAELLNGVVFMPSPVRVDRHGRQHLHLATWLGTYEIATPGLLGGDNSTIRLAPASEPQPDLLLTVPRERGGQSWVDDEGYVAGAPELAVEVAASSATYDLHEKLEVYREHGVREYLVWRVLDRAVDWFTLREGGYEPLRADDQRIVRSEHFPGLWLDTGALLSGEYQRVLRVLQQGIASPEHAAFVKRLAGS